MEYDASPDVDLDHDAVFIPDLCGMRALFVVVVVSELAAIMIVVAGTGFVHAFFDKLALVSLYSQWLGISSAAVLCMARRPLSGQGQAVIATLSFLLVVAVVYAVAEIAWWIVNPVVGAGALISLSHRELVLRTVCIGAIIAVLVLRYFYVQFHRKQRMASAASARMQALQARIRPHFFFNCMNTIASLTRTDPALAERAVEDLADLFRASFTDARAPVSVDDEIAFVERYLNIERLRLGPRLEVVWHRDPLPPGAKLPLLTLQPVVENAIYHGIEPVSGGGSIEITLRTTGRRLEVEVANPVGAEGARRPGNRIALDNVRQRLFAHFGDRTRFEAGREGDRYRVRLSVPLERADA